MQIEATFNKYCQKFSANVWVANLLLSKKKVIP